ncbi:MAG: hypothetical protein AAF720_05365 [Pseudomonadota bacterium]
MRAQTKILISVAITFLLTACATTEPTPFEPLNSRGYGYSEIKIEDNRYRIVFAGNGGTPADLVETYALRRAAQVTLENGYDWFRVIFRNVTASERGGVNVGAGMGTGSFGRRGGVSVGLGSDIGTFGARRYYTARIEVILGSGEKPSEAKDDPAYFDAQSVIDAADSFVAPLLDGDRPNRRPDVEVPQTDKLDATANNDKVVSNT